MNLIKEVLKSVGADDLLSVDYTFTVCGKSGARFQNVTGITDVKKSVVILKIKKGRITVNGEDLSVGAFSDGDLTVKGKITSVGVENE